MAPPNPELIGTPEGADRAKRRRKILRRVSLAASLVLLAALLWWGVPVSLCGGPLSGLRHSDGECVGVTDGSFVFDPRFADIQADIKAENDRAAAEAEADGTPLVKIALLAPLTPTDNSPLNHEQARSALEGAYVALHRANRTAALGGRQPLVQLHLANEGSVQQGWEGTTAQLARMTEDDVPLVAVMGQALGTDSTEAAARYLSDQGIPMVTGAVTADGLDHGTVEGLIRAAPSNTDFALALRNHLDERGDLETGMLVHDNTEADTFTTTLRAAYESQLGKYIQFSHQPFPGASVQQGGPDVFYLVTQNICNENPDLILFAGRAPDLETFLEALGERSCRGDPLTVLFAELGLYPRGEILGQLEEDNLTLLHATGADPGWARGNAPTPTGFSDFHEHFENLVGGSPEALDNGYAISYHDSLAIAVHAVRITNPWDDTAPSPSDVRDHLLLLNSGESVEAAGGTLSFNENRAGHPGGKHVPVIPLPASAERVADPYITPSE